MSESEPEPLVDDEAEELVGLVDDDEEEEEEDEDEAVAKARARVLEHLSKKGVKVAEYTEEFMYDLVTQQNAADDRTAACHRQAKEIAAERERTSNLYSLVHFFENTLEPYIVKKYGRDWVSRLAR